MIAVPYDFEPNLTAAEFQKIGQFACRWAVIDNALANCLRVLLKMEPEDASIMIFPLSQDIRMQRIEAFTKRSGRLSQEQIALFLELKPLIRAMQFLRTTALHGIVDREAKGFSLRSKSRWLGKVDLFQCEELINYAAHVVLAFRLSLGDTNWAGMPYALPDRPLIPDFLPADCRAFHAQSKGGRLAQRGPSRA